MEYAISFRLAPVLRDAQRLVIERRSALPGRTAREREKTESERPLALLLSSRQAGRAFREETLEARG
jgi:hypothetical protein